MKIIFLMFFLLTITDLFKSKLVSNVLGLIIFDFQTVSAVNGAYSRHCHTVALSLCHFVALSLCRIVACRIVALLTLRKLPKSTCKNQQGKNVTIRRLNPTVRVNICVKGTEHYW